MFNRKITPESFDHSLSEYNDFNPEQATNRDMFHQESLLNNKIDYETGEILNTKIPDDTVAKHSKNSWQSYDRPIPNSKPHEASTPLKHSLFSFDKFSQIFYFSVSIGVSILCCSINYYVHSIKFSKINTQYSQLTAKVDHLSSNLPSKETTLSENEDIDELFDELRTLSQDLENLEDNFEKHVQTSNKQSAKTFAKPTLITDTLKNISYIGIFGTLDRPQALIKIQEKISPFQIGQEIHDFWQLTAITSSRITLTHRSGVSHALERR